MNTQSILEAQHADGFVDFYTLVAASPSMNADELREQINVLYKDAQIDRDHRTPTRRREAQLLLELLPQARTVLLDAKRRRRYDAYRGAVEMQSPRMPFEEFLPVLLNEREAAPATSDILSVSRRSAKADAAPLVESPHETLLETVGSAPTESAPPAVPAKNLKLPLGPLVGAVGTFLGLSATLPSLASIPLVASAPLAIVGALVVGYVFSQTGDLALETA